MNLETSVTCTHARCNWVVFAVCDYEVYGNEGNCCIFLGTGNSGGTEKGL